MAKFSLYFTGGWVVHNLIVFLFLNSTYVWSLTRQMPSTISYQNFKLSHEWHHWTSQVFWFLHIHQLFLDFRIVRWPATFIFVGISASSSLMSLTNCCHSTSSLLIQALNEFSFIFRGFFTVFLLWIKITTIEAFMQWPDNMLYVKTWIIYKKEAIQWNNVLDYVTSKFTLPKWAYGWENTTSRLEKKCTITLL